MKILEISNNQINSNNFSKLLKFNCPIVFRGLASEWDCVRRWGDSNYLRQVAQKEETDFAHRKYRQFSSVIEEDGRLHLTDGKSKFKSVSISEFLSTCEAPHEAGLYLLGIHDGKGGVNYCPVQPHPDDAGRVPPLAADVPRQIDWLDWYGDSLGGAKYDHQQFFLANGYSFTDLHYDSYDNFYVCVSGTRRWTLACPSASRWLIDSAGGKLKSASPCVPHCGQYPEGSPAQLYPFAYVDLAPGDVLFVPACWWHLVEGKGAADGFSSAFNFFFSKDPNQVFTQFEKSLSEVDSLVNEQQSECRSRMAENSPADVQLDDKYWTAPGRMSQDQWDVVTRVMKSHGFVDQVKILHDLHSVDSIIKWTESMEPPTERGRLAEKIPEPTRRGRSLKRIGSRE
jgi:hypothetical protein